MEYSRQSVDTLLILLRSDTVARGTVLALAVFAGVRNVLDLTVFHNIVLVVHNVVRVVVRKIVEVLDTLSVARTIVVVLRNIVAVAAAPAAAASQHEKLAFFDQVLQDLLVD